MISAERYDLGNGKVRCRYLLGPVIDASRSGNDGVGVMGRAARLDFAKVNGALGKALRRAAVHVVV